MSLADPFLFDDVHLGRAGSLLILELCVVVILGATLPQVGLDPDFAALAALLAAMLVNFAAAWHLAQAARKLGRSALGFGVMAALAPIAALLVWSHLKQLALTAQIDRRLDPEDDDLPDRYIDPDGIVHERDDSLR